LLFFSPVSSVSAEEDSEKFYPGTAEESSYVWVKIRFQKE